VRTLGLHLAVAAAYVTLGVFVPQLLISWPVGVGFFLLGVWGVPALVRRRR
jgi:hypothetical protein